MKLVHTLTATALAAALVVPTAFAATTSAWSAPKAHVAAMKKVVKKTMMKGNKKMVMKKMTMMKGGMKKTVVKKTMKKTM